MQKASLNGVLTIHQALSKCFPCATLCNVHSDSLEGETSIIHRKTSSQDVVQEGHAASTEWNSMRNFWVSMPRLSRVLWAVGRHTAGVEGAPTVCGRACDCSLCRSQVCHVSQGVDNHLVYMPETPHISGVLLLVKNLVPYLIKLIIGVPREIPGDQKPSWRCRLPEKQYLEDDSGPKWQSHWLLSILEP